MNPQQPPHQPGGWNSPQPGYGYPAPGQPQQTPPGVAGLSRVPLLPAVMGVLLVVGFAGMFIGPSSAFGGTSHSELCSAYSSMSTVMYGDDYNVSTEYDDLKDAAAGYDDEDVQADAERLGDIGGSLISVSEFESATRNIRAECN